MKNMKHEAHEGLAKGTKKQLDIIFVQFNMLNLRPLFCLSALRGFMFI